MSISDLIKSKSVSDQARVESLRAERGNLSDLRDAALEEITTRRTTSHAAPGMWP